MQRILLGLQVAGQSNYIKSRSLRPIVLSDIAKWEEEMEKAEKKQTPIKVGDKSLKRFAKILATFPEENFSA